MSVMNETESLPAPTSTKDKSSSSSATFHLTQSARNTKDIKRLINTLLESDREISQLIPKEVSGNALVNKFREEVLGELYQLIEFALINSDSKRGSMPPKHLLQERLASLTNPQNT